MDVFLQLTYFKWFVKKLFVVPERVNFSQFSRTLQNHL